MPLKGSAGKLDRVHLWRGPRQMPASVILSQKCDRVSFVQCRCRGRAARIGVGEHVAPPIIGGKSSFLVRVNRGPFHKLCALPLESSRTRWRVVPCSSEAVSKCCGVLHFVGFGNTVRKAWASSISGNSGVGEKPSNAGARTSCASRGLSVD
jgi:hypothetical protein